MTKEDTHLFQGMRRDNHPVRQDSKYLWDARNIRFTATDDNTLLSITNEKGTSHITDIEGTYIGHCVIGEYIVIFTRHDNTNKIYRIDRDFNIYIVFSGELNMTPEYPAQTLGIFEGPLVQKVYWTDGKNQPRVINIMKDYSNETFDFVQNLSLNEIITVERKEGSGIFAPGVIQYCFSYYNKYGQESNIFYTTELLYSSPVNRGGNPEETVSNVFSIKVENADRKFQYLRIYSIQRTSVDSVPVVKRVADIPVTSDVITYTDTGTTGDTVDPMKLLYIGGEDIVAHTIEQKDNTLFLGNIEINRSNLTQEFKDEGIEQFGEAQSNIRTVKLDEYTNPKSFYINNHQMIKGNTSGFKSNERYRIGIQFQYKNGKWSEPLYIKDTVITHKPDLINDKDEGQILKVPCIDITIPQDIVSFASDRGYVKVRPVVVYPQIQDREVIAQGMLCPTVFNVGNRKNNTPFVQSSWFIRPNLPVEVPSVNNNTDIDKGAFVEFRHLHGLMGLNNRGAEIQGSVPLILQSVNLDYYSGNDEYQSGYMVDQSVITMHSPDIEFDDSVQQAIDGNKLKLRITGLINFTANSGDIDIQTSSPAVNSGAQGFYHKALTSVWEQDNKILPARSLVSGMFYKDSMVDDDGDKYTAYPKDDVYSFMIYPWHRSGSLNNDTNRPDGKGTRTAVLKRKRISNLKFSSHNTWLSSPYYLPNGITPVSVFNSDQVSMIKIPVPENSGIASMIYYGNVDTVITHKKKYPIYVTTDDTDQFMSGDIKKVNEVYNGIGDTDTSLKETSEPIRMKYKSTAHAVFAINHLNQGSVWNNPVCLPSVGGKNRNTVSEVPFWTEKIKINPDDTTQYDVKQCHYGLKERDNEGNLIPPPDNLPLVKVYPEYHDGVGMYQLCKWTEQGWVRDDETMMSQADKNPAVIYHPVEYNFRSMYFQVRYMGSGPVLQLIQSVNQGSYDYEITQDNIDTTSEYPTLLLAELYRDKPDNQFGGDSDEAKRNNLWFPAGKPVMLSNEDMTVQAIYGDTWYQRYDCLKTYPFTQEDENSIIEIASFMCETRVNTDGRYDRNRGQSSNLNVSPQNFNLLNKVYSQRDNFFNYRIYDEDYYKVTKFPNQILWSSQKSHLEETDSWTNITLASSYDMDGNKGPVRAIVNFNDNLFCFQDKALSQLLFNSRVQIPVSDGVPVEISNNYKMEGSRVIADQTGCQDKFSLVTTPNGIYFTDSITGTIYLFNGQINDLSAEKGMSVWARHINCETWQYGVKGMRLYYDPKLRDVYFVPGDKEQSALCYSEALGQFTSMFDYGGTVMIPLYGSLYAVHNSKIYKLMDNDSYMIFGHNKPYYISFISNDVPSVTKIFDTIEFRADTEDNSKPFNYIIAENEYQNTGPVTLDNINLRKKFRVWRGIIPRDKNVRDGIRHKYGLSRIRNTWVKITLGNNINNTGMIFHDISVKYTV